MHAEMDAAPQDDASQAAVMERHWRDALRGGAVPDDDHDARDTILSCLYHAHECRPEVSAERMGMSLRFLSSSPAPAQVSGSDGPEMTPEETIAAFRRAMAERAKRAKRETMRRKP
jgi:hypothetical protein